MTMGESHTERAVSHPYRSTSLSQMSNAGEALFVGWAAATIYWWHPAPVVGASPSSILGVPAGTTRDGDIYGWVTPSNEKGTEAMQETSFRHALRLPSLLNWCATHFKTCSYRGQGQPRTGTCLQPVQSPWKGPPTCQGHALTLQLYSWSSPPHCLFTFLVPHQADPKVLPSLGTPTPTATGLWQVTKPLTTSTNLKTSQPVT